MGAKQSKRSVDISGKEAESAGEVAAAIAGGEGRVEQLADADALKPQLNGDAHIHETEEKQKDIDSGTPENEKDATTEKEAKMQEEEKEAAPLTNGESEQKVENGESTPTPEDGKKPKKEKVKKKWSLRSISFSRKDKPKQEKKQKDEEPKTNGEPEKVPEEAAEVAPDVPAVTESAEEAKTPSEVKEDKTPETPVTEPITNGSSTPESPKVESPVVEEPAAPSPEIERPEPKAEPEPEQLPVNGLSLEEPAKETTENENSGDCKEEPTAETTEIVPEISVKKEVCVEQMPLIDSTPPPLPANPPPSSVASFAATTMAPELTDASLANTADNAIPPPPSDPIAKDNLDITPTDPEQALTVIQTVNNELPSPIKEVIQETLAPVVEKGVENDVKETVVDYAVPVLVEHVKNISETVETTVTDNDKALLNSDLEMPAPLSELVENKIVSTKIVEPDMPSPPSEIVEPLVIEKISSETAETEMPSPPSELIEEQVVEKEKETSDYDESAMPTPPSEQIIEKEKESSENDDSAMPTPPSELVEDPVINNEIEKEKVSEMPVPPAVVIEEPVIEEEAVSASPASEMPAPPMEVSVVVTEVNTEVLNNVEDLPSPPPPICDDAADVISANNVIVKLDNRTETIHETNKIGINISHSEETPKNVEPKNDNEDLEQNIKNKSKDSLGNLIKSIECNGNIDNVKATSEKEAAEIVPPINIKEILNVEPTRMVTTTDDLSAAGESIPPPPSHPESIASPDPATPQEPLPVSDKLADLIPEVPEVPELKTETLQETTNDVAVAN